MVAILLSLLVCAPAEPDRLDNARKLVAAGKYADALVDLQAVSEMYGNTPREQAEIAALRATALLGLPPSPEHRVDAVQSLTEMFHIDPEGTALNHATDDAKALALHVKAERTLVLTDRIYVARSGRPLRIRARLEGARIGEPQLFLNYSAEHGSNQPEYVRVPMERVPSADAYEAWLRPGVGGVPAGGEHLLLYYIEALDPGGLMLDSNGTANNPIRMTLSETLPEAAGVAALEEGGRPAHPAPPQAPAPPRPWYKRWSIIGPIVGALVIGGTVYLIATQPKPQPTEGNLGRLDLP